jgi:hypothetical protein
MLCACHVCTRKQHLRHHTGPPSRLPGDWPMGSTSSNHGDWPWICRVALQLRTPMCSSRPRGTRHAANVVRYLPHGNRTTFATRHAACSSPSHTPQHTVPCSAPAAVPPDLTNCPARPAAETPTTGPARPGLPRTCRLGMRAGRCRAAARQPGRIAARRGGCHPPGGPRARLIARASHRPLDRVRVRASVRRAMRCGAARRARPVGMRARGGQGGGAPRRHRHM